MAHIVNPVIVPVTSDLCAAQPVTFESMRVAQRFAGDLVRVVLVSAQFAEDRAIVPDDFVAAPDLDRSVLDVDGGRFQTPRRLPLLADILDRLYDAASDAEYLIYTNVDIALQPGFYLAVDRLLDEGIDALVINRRTISDQDQEASRLPLLYGQLGEKHPGHDCFIFRRDVYPNYQLGRACVGMAWIAKLLMLNMAYCARRFVIRTDLHLTFHVGDPRPWQDPRFADYRAHNRRQFAAARQAFQSRLGLLADRLGPDSTVPPEIELQPPWYLAAARRLVPAPVYAAAKRMYRTVRPAPSDE